MALAPGTMGSFPEVPIGLDWSVGIAQAGKGRMVKNEGEWSY